MDRKTENPGYEEVGPHDEKILQDVISEAQALLLAYPAYHTEEAEISPDEQIRMAAEVLVGRGVLAARNHQWLAPRLDDVTRLVLVKQFLIRRLLELLDQRDDIQKMISHLRKKSLDEQECFDIIVDAIVTLVQRGHGAKLEDTLLSFFRTVLFEKAHDYIEKRTRQQQREHTTETLETAKDHRRHSTIGTIVEQLSDQENLQILLDNIITFDAPPEQKVALILKHAEDWSSKQIADVIGVAPAKVDHMNYESRRRLQKKRSMETYRSSPIQQCNATPSSSLRSAIDEIPNISEQAAMLLHLGYQLPPNQVAEACKLDSVAVTELATAITARLVSSEGFDTDN